MAATGIDDGGIRRAFLDEAEDLSRKLGETLSSLETDRGNLTLVNEVFRLTHSLKSESALMGYTTLSVLAHRMEDVLGLAREGTLALEKPILDALFAGADLIAEMMGSIGRGRSDADHDTTPALRALSEATRQGAEAGAGGAAGAARAGAAQARQGAEVGLSPEAGPTPPFALSDTALSQLAEARDRGEGLYLLSLRVDETEPMKFARAYLAFSNLETRANVVAVSPGMDGEPAEDAAYARTTLLLTSGDGEDQLRAAAGVDQVSVADLLKLDFGAVLAPSTARPAEGPPASPLDEQGRRAGATEKTTIRVDTRKLDDLWSLIAELVMHKSHIARLSGDLGRGVDAQTVREELTESFDSLDKISSGMQQVMMDTRMIPIAVIFSKFPRLVRDLSRKLGKSVDLALEGEDTEIDRGIIEALSDPLTHVIRNSLDHGIEFPEERVRGGKSERGRVTISARRQGGSIVIELADDGRGVDVEGIRRKAIGMGLKDAERMGESQLLDLVFLPGFSTKEVVTDLSGRGVGMDVVATRIRGDLKGDVVLQSVPGRGTRVILRLPLTLTIVNALLVRGDAQLYAIPLTDVDSTTTVLTTELRGEEGGEIAVWEDTEIPVYSLGALLGNGRHPADEYSAAVLRHGDRRAFLIVDELREEREVVIKPVDDLLNAHRLFSGVSVLEDGRPVFILDTSFIRSRHSREEISWAPRY